MNVNEFIRETEGKENKGGDPRANEPIRTNEETKDVWDAIFKERGFDDLGNPYPPGRLTNG